MKQFFALMALAMALMGCNPAVLTGVGVTVGPEVLAGLCAGDRSILSPATQTACVAHDARRARLGAPPGVATWGMSP